METSTLTNLSIQSAFSAYGTISLINLPRNIINTAQNIISGNINPETVVSAISVGYSIYTTINTVRSATSGDSYAISRIAALGGSLLGGFSGAIAASTAVLIPDALGTEIAKDLEKGLKGLHIS
jgi:hypothetical protein